MGRWNNEWEEFVKIYNIDSTMKHSYLRLAPKPALLKKIEMIVPDWNKGDEAAAIKILQSFAVEGNLDEVSTYKLLKMSQMTNEGSRSFLGRLMQNARSCKLTTTTQHTCRRCKFSENIEVSLNKWCVRQLLITNSSSNPIREKLFNLPEFEDMDAQAIQQYMEKQELLNSALTTVGSTKPATNNTNTGKTTKECVATGCTKTATINSKTGVQYVFCPEHFAAYIDKKKKEKEEEKKEINKPAGVANAIQVGGAAAGPKIFTITAASVQQKRRTWKGLPGRLISSIIGDTSS